MSEQSKALAKVEPHSAMARPSDFGEEHMRIVREAFASGASQTEFEVLWAGAKARGLDPVKKQIYFVSRYDEAKGKSTWSSQTSIDGFRAIAEATGQYEGQDEPTYERDKEEGYLIARVTVYRKGRRPSVGVARWPEFAQMKGNQPTYMWKKMPYHMLAKCAEALALRKAFPEDLAGLYAPEEMGSEEVVSAAEKADAITVAVDPAPADEETIVAATEQFRIAALAIAERRDAEGYRAALETFRHWCEQNGVPAARCKAAIDAVKLAVAKAVGTVGDTATEERPAA